MIYFLLTINIVLSLFILWKLYWYKIEKKKVYLEKKSDKLSLGKKFLNKNIKKDPFEWKRIEDIIFSNIK